MKALLDLFRKDTGARTVNILDSYVQSSPDPQNALDIFKEEWASKLPGKLAALQAGEIPLFEDTRLAWGVNEANGVHGKSVLDLGPLEGGHAYMLEHLGAKEITAIEGNTRAFLKCLIVKELLDMRRVHFLCGNFVEYLRNCKVTFDFCNASGVLYHMSNPAELIALTAQVADAVYLWTHYYDETVITSTSHVSDRVSAGESLEYLGFKYTAHRQEYGEFLKHNRFFGGPASYSNWMERNDILRCLRHFGLSDIRIAFEYPGHIGGPCFSLLAMRPKS
jgi:Protein of unknown function (DUF1698)